MSGLRGKLLLAVFLSAGMFTGVSAVGPRQPAGEPAGQGVQVDLRTQLVVGLRPGLPVEFAFIDRAVRAVNSGRLPRRLVNGAFLWARRKPKNRVEYFRAALVRLAAKEGITF